MSVTDDGIADSVPATSVTVDRPRRAIPSRRWRGVRLGRRA